MKKYSFLFYAFLCICFTLFFSGCGGNEKKTSKEKMGRLAYYNDLTNDMISISPKQLGLKFSGDDITIYGIITEQNVGNFFIMVSAAYITGESVDMIYGGNCFINTGGGGTSENVSKYLFKTVKKYLDYYKSDVEKYWKNKNVYEISQTLLMTFFINEDDEELKNSVIDFIKSVQNASLLPENADKDGALPEAGEIKINFLTNKGRFFVKDTAQNLISHGYGFAHLLKQRGYIADMIFQRYAPAPSVSANRQNYKGI